MKPQILATGLCILAFGAGAARGAAYVNSAPPIASQYGLIQNVQNYSSNPFWDPNGPYNQRMPQPIYVQGADLNTGDCQRTVAALVGTYCAMRNNCVDMHLADARPDLMIELSRLPGHNYAGACSGFIDEEFNSYVSKYANAAPRIGASFPSGTVQNPDTQNNTEFKLQNPFVPKVDPNAPKSWREEMKERQQELKDLQSQNGAGNARLARADFPTTTADLSFSQRMANRAAGYEPYKDSSAYRQLRIESEEAYRARKQAYCQQALQPTLAVLKSDLETLQKCKADGVKFADCKVQGIYQ